MGGCLALPLEPARSREGALAALDGIVRAHAAGARARACGVREVALSVYGTEGGALAHRVDTGGAGARRLNVASASKLVSGLMLLRCVHEGHLRLGSTAGELLGWPGEMGAITLRQLGSMTSGLAEDDDALYEPGLALGEVAERIRARGLRSRPGARFLYKQTDWQVAARMAEVATGRPWAALFESLKAALGLDDPALRYRCARAGDTHAFLYGRRIAFADGANPLVGGGLHATADELAALCLLAANRGRTRAGEQIIARELIDGAMFQEPTPRARMSAGPAEVARLGLLLLGSGYGFGCWLEGARRRRRGPTSVVSSPGVFGCTPWIDLAEGYVGVVSSEGDAVGAAEFAFLLKARAQPVVARALGKAGGVTTV